MVLRRTPKPLVDRSRNRETITFESGIRTAEQKSRALDAVRRSGIPAANASSALNEFLDAFKWFHQGDSTRAERPGPAAQRKELDGLIRRGEALLEALEMLSPITRTGINAADVDLRIPELDPREIAEAVRVLLSRARAVRSGVQAEGRGRSRDFGLADLARGMDRVWRKYLPNTSGVRRHGGAASSAKVFRGPLLDLTVALCRMDGARFSSRFAIGRALFTARRSAERDQK